MTGSVESKIRHKMESRGIPSSVIEEFLHQVGQTEGRPTHVPLEEVAAPTANLVLDPSRNSEYLRELEQRGRRLLQRVVVIKLNGGRSTTMGGGVPKGVLRAKNGLCYLEIVIGQVQALCKKWRTEIPLVLMNSFFTQGPTMEVVKRFDLPIFTFVQNEVPRLAEHAMVPLETGTEEDWAPPGHGDIYAGLYRDGLLEKLIKQGYRRAFISNLDNLAASLEPWIVGLIEEQGIDFLLEVTDRTSADRKGGTLIVRNGKLDLLEIAQVSPEQREEFMDIERFSVFNTNNVWVDLTALSELIVKGSLGLPLIQNHKNVMGNRVIQLETAMGAAVGSFPNARGLKVDRSRFFPTKKVSDLFVLQSDACVLDSMNRLRRNPARPALLPYLPRIYFDPEFVDSPEQIKERFEDPGSVSLVYADSLEVSGPVYFEANIRIEGNVQIKAHSGQLYRIPNGSVLRDGRYP
ncbi:MAG TPA: UTP--glucose-1-phosphate uridylyltransferase [Desulfomonilaceae bacterium]|nr:UTP--glucose-1-phosphate uridylyltransferase [Desulfomonilaceae bacterium]